MAESEKKTEGIRFLLVINSEKQLILAIIVHKFIIKMVEKGEKTASHSL